MSRATAKQRERRKTLEKYKKRARAILRAKEKNMIANNVLESGKIYRVLANTIMNIGFVRSGVVLMTQYSDGSGERHEVKPGTLVVYISHERIVPVTNQVFGNFPYWAVKVLAGEVYGYLRYRCDGDLVDGVFKSHPHLQRVKEPHPGRSEKLSKKQARSSETQV